MAGLVEYSDSSSSESEPNDDTSEKTQNKSDAVQSTIPNKRSLTEQQSTNIETDNSDVTEPPTKRQKTNDSSNSEAANSQSQSSIKPQLSSLNIPSSQSDSSDSDSDSDSDDSDSDSDNNSDSSTEQTSKNQKQKPKFALSHLIKPTAISDGIATNAQQSSSIGIDFLESKFREERMVENEQKIHDSMLVHRHRRRLGKERSDITDTDRSAVQTKESRANRDKKRKKNQSAWLETLTNDGSKVVSKATMGDRSKATASNSVAMGKMTVKDKERMKRKKGQSSQHGWKSETFMKLRQQFD